MFLNRGDGTFDEATASVFGESPLLTRVIKVGDLDDDGHADIVVGTTYDTQSRLLLGTGERLVHRRDRHQPAGRGAERRGSGAR